MLMYGWNKENTYLVDDMKMESVAILEDVERFSINSNIFLTIISTNLWVSTDIRLTTSPVVVSALP